MIHDCRDKRVSEDLPGPGLLRTMLRRRWIRWRSKFTSERGLMGWATLEASFPMLPVETVLIPLTRLRPSAAEHLAALATVFSGVGSIYSYARALRFYLVTSLTVHFNTGKQNVSTES